MIKLKVKKGDEVVVITGKHKGKKGKILKVFPEDSKVIVSGVNVVKKHTKPNQMSEGGIITKELPIHISNIAHIDPKTGNPTKVAFKFLEDGSKVRVAKKSGEIIGKEGK
ncbi:50S ribosomal protein L24 [Rickettsia rickettsii]|uniref:Large ribosomal subunit protein uL24 n=2 Tax=Rickettsia rickettsii TaxID=783 RepID=RL24_RICRO|nr:50S ribosomal protein L24 [Rickettsia rickettsii]A8GT58.1 RecName: Full=Large ribosomal subunit protein uL24; AltName: Full=50S ribosomal protein L24 [Rickettsia rickettsii str. 'Sheila Smith']B0BUP9.1 RecName: Full=Large ribosomal subunit protein uL24; AltName: Full=50S ribosomal protein L24 [Rickettsia rickettsii str. Iowa]ABV76583.1 50S ribosomal protein L24 [Rickettsia rickettsii str. 'Sheila Smith']ABY72959.1 LSU ribosomal protein L24P [Rickettsia rickettsii str. Iowa]AFB21845.1 50S ri